MQRGRDYRVVQDEIWDVPDMDEARELLRLGLARIPDPAPVVYETKVVTPAAPEVAANLPFRVLRHADKGPASIHQTGGPLLPIPDLPPPGTSDSGRRKAGRSGDASR